MKNFFLHLFIVFSFIVSSEIQIEPNIEILNEKYIDDIVFIIEPFNISTFILNKFHPNSFVDYKENSLKIDGTLGLPIYQTITEKLYFDNSKSGTFSQLSYKQKKTDLFYDTKIAVKSDINDQSDFVLKAESKSIYSNINQNYLLSINKLNKKNQFSVDYLYHIEEDPSIDFYQDVNMKVESFHGGYQFVSSSDKVTFNSNSSMQFSNNSRYQGQDYIYDYQSIWSDNMISYNINSLFEINIKQLYKKYIIESTSSVNSNNRNLVSFNVLYNVKSNFDIQFGIASFLKQNEGEIKLNYKNNHFSLSLTSSNIIIDQIENSIEPNIEYQYFRNNQFLISFNDLNRNNYSFSYGRMISDVYISNNENYYDYILFNGKLNLPQFLFTYKYYNYSKSEILSLNSYFHFEAVYSPIIKGKRFRPFGKVFGNYYKFNFNKEVNLSNVLIFDNVSNQNNFIEDIKLLNYELGFIFDSFKISYIKLNPTIQEVEISNSINFIRYDYINLVWFFDD